MNKAQVSPLIADDRLMSTPHRRRYPRRFPQGKFCYIIYIQETADQVTPHVTFASSVANAIFSVMTRGVLSSITGMGTLHWQLQDPPTELSKAQIARLVTENNERWPFAS